MHNSLHIRDLLRQTNSDPLYLARRDPHRGLMADPDAVPGPGEFALQGRWCVKCDDLGGADEMAEDLADALSRLGVQVYREAEQAVQIVRVQDLPPGAYRLSLDPREMRIEGADAAGLWAGLTWLEWEMRVRRGPFLPRTEIVRHPQWPVQISQGPWGGNYSVPDFSPEYLSDDSFRLYAHYGVNSMMIYGDILCYVNSAIFPELNSAHYARNVAVLKDAARRALKYGVRFAYVVVGPKLRASHPLFQRHPGARGSGIPSRVEERTIHCLCSSDEACLAFYEETFENLFAQVPELAGLNLIIGGESYYHCHMWSRATVRCPRCYAQDAEDVVARLVGVTADAVHRAQPDAFVNAWPYNTDAWERPDCHELIRRLPPCVGFYDQIDRNQSYQKEGYVKKIWDYSVDYIGPSDSIRARARLVKERGLDLFVKTETGIGLEVFQYPYVPAMQRLADKWLGLRGLAPQGVQQSWLFFGMFGSRAEELALWARYCPDVPRDAFLRAMARRDFGPEAIDLVLRAWSSLSQAAGHIPCITLRTYYVGPSFLGPCHPLVPEKGAAIPDAFYGVLYYLQENEETFSRARTVVRTSLVMDALPDSARAVQIEWPGGGDGWAIVLREYRAAASDARSAWRTLLAARALARTNADAENLAHETALVELIYRTFASCANTVAFLRARKRWEETGDPGHGEEMRRIAAEERKNALAAIPIYERAPWLDLAARTDGVFTPCAQMIGEKVTWIDGFLDGGRHL
jgi:hypothetical protein